MAPGLMPSPRHPGGRRLLLTSLTGETVNGAWPRAVAPSSLRTSSPARIPNWEREEGKLCQWRPASCRRLVISADVVSRRDNTLLSPNAPGGGDSSTCQASSSTTHSVTRPAPSASMVENPANAISFFGSYGWFIMFICVSIRYISFLVSFLSVLMLTPQSAESLPSCLQFLRALWRPNPCLSFPLSACVLRCLRPYLLLHCGCRHPSSSDFPWWGGVPTTSSQECGAGGVCPPRFPPTHPLPKNEKLDEKMRRIG